MVNRIYVETSVADHHRTRRISERFDSAEVTPCERYGEVFNPAAQNFRLQKSNPSLILARKHERHVLSAPAGYGLAGDAGFYFSHMLNCPYDCRYCFLQGMYRSANYVIFVNYEAFVEAIDRTLASTEGQVWFNAGYDCDSLAWEPVTGFVDFFVPAFAERPRATLELRSKSTQIRSLLRQEPVDNVVVAFSFSPQHVHEQLENGVPSIRKRIDAACRLQNAGWTVAIRFEPLVYFENYNDHYQQLIDDVLGALDGDRLHSVSIGSFRMPDAFFTKARSLYPQEPLFVTTGHSRGGVTGYGEEIEESMAQYCRQLILRHIDDKRFYRCQEAAR